MKLPLLSARKLVKALEKHGFQYAPKRGKGSHVALVRKTKEGDTFLVIIPMKDPIPRGTLLSIIKQSGFLREEFLRILK
jgi:predicted RNA binding protein YcfA (HicA-like mRNA interferase family)